MKRLFQYLFIISFLMNLFMYMYFSKQVSFSQSRYENLKEKYTDSIQKLNSKLFEATYFTIEKNESAQEYFENTQKGTFIPVEKLVPHVKEALLTYNDSHEGNIYTGYDPMGGMKFIIERIRIINHRWIVADFSNGSYSGETFLKYFIEEDESVSFEHVQSFLYPK